MFSEQGKQVAVEKNSWRDLSSTAVESCSKGGDKIPFSSSGHSCLNCEKSHLLLQPPASPYTPSRSEAASCSQRSCSLLPGSFIGQLHPLHGHMVGEALAVVSSSFPPRPHPMVLSPPSCQRWNSFDSWVSLLRALNKNENTLSCFLGYFSTRLLLWRGSLRDAEERLCWHKEGPGLPGLWEEQGHSNTGLDPLKWFGIVCCGSFTTAISWCKLGLLLVHQSFPSSHGLALLLTLVCETRQESLVGNRYGLNSMHLKNSVVSCLFIAWLHACISHHKEWWDLGQERAEMFLAVAASADLWCSWDWTFSKMGSWEVSRLAV